MKMRREQDLLYSKIMAQRGSGEDAPMKVRWACACPCCCPCGCLCHGEELECPAIPRSHSMGLQALGRCQHSPSPFSYPCFNPSHRHLSAPTPSIPCSFRVVDPFDLWIWVQLYRPPTSSEAEMLQVGRAGQGRA